MGKEGKTRCKNCKWIEELPFSNTYICENNYSSYAGCDCDIENDSCEAWEEKESNVRKT